MDKKTNKETFKSECLNLHIFHKGSMYESQYGLMMASTKDYVHPPMSREELKGLAEFINNYLENN